jgi:glucose-6-phosphate 1-dehydrogenase
MTDIIPSSHAHEIPNPIPAAVFTVFGATGDLSMRYIMPTLLHMDAEHLFPENFSIIAAGRRDISTSDFFGLLEDAGKLPEVNGDAFKRFKSRVQYVSASFEDPDSFKKLEELIGDRAGDESGTGHRCFNRFFYFAVAPKYFAEGARLLHEHNLVGACSEHGKTVRLMIEKPFGSDLASAKELDISLLKHFTEEQIYRTDHYLGKETVQNLLVMRFANEFLEPIWNKEYVDHVEISMLEAEGVGKRASTYDPIGALRDVVQNHLLQLLAFVAMEKPEKNDAHSLRSAKASVLQAVQPFTAETIKRNVVRGQYGMGEEKGERAESYIDENGSPSTTETYVALKTSIDTPRWKDVPFYVRTGKRMKHRIAEISVHFKIQPNALFSDKVLQPNVISVQLQPTEKIVLRINNKIPGAMELHSGDLTFNYEDQFHEDTPPSYERLFLDFFSGDQRLFIRADEVLASWAFVDSIASAWTEENAPLHVYISGTAGPNESEEMLERDGRTWFTK